MKIMYFLHEGGEYFNGASRSILSVIRASADAGNENLVVIPLPGGRLQEALDRIPNTRVIVQPFYRWKDYRRKNAMRQAAHTMRYFAIRSLKNRKAARRLANFAREAGADLIHTNSSVINLGALVSRYTGIPHIWHFREFGEEDFGLYPFVPQRAFYRFVDRNAVAVVCISDAIRQKVSRYLNPEKVMKIYNGVPVEKERPEPKEKRECLNLLISGVISEKKGQRIAVEAVRQMVKKGVTGIHLTIAGSGCAEALGEHYAEVKEYVTMPGFVDDMKGLRRNMDVELVCSFSEGFGRTTVEAMAAGLIVIGADGGATPELIEPGETGFLFPVNEPCALTERIEKVMRMSQAERQTMREKAFASVSTRFSEEGYTDNVLALYRRIAGEGAR